VRGYTEKRLYDNARELLDTHRHWGPQTVSRELNKRISGWFGYYTIPGVSYPMTTAYRMEEKLSYKLHKYYKRKSQRKSRFATNGAYKTLVDIFGLVKMTTWPKIKATANV
jgi:RNA-directed DNA polymerase